MTQEELLTKAMRIYDEYIPSQEVDEDLQERLSNFLFDKAVIDNFLTITPSHMIAGEVVKDYPYAVAKEVKCHGGEVRLPEDFLKLIAFKHRDWDRSIYQEDVITASHPLRRLQGDEMTEGGVSRPVVCIENRKGYTSLLFWGYKTDKNNIEEFQYIRKSIGIEDILCQSEVVIDLYIYFSLIALARVSLRPEEEAAFTKLYQELSIANNMPPVYPISLSKK